MGETVEFYFSTGLCRRGLTKSRPVCLRGGNVMTQEEWEVFANNINNATMLYSALLFASCASGLVFIGMMIYFGSQWVEFDNYDFNQSAWIAGLVVVGVFTVVCIAVNLCMVFPRTEEKIRRICEDASANKQALDLSYTKKVDTSYYWRRRSDDDELTPRERRRYHDRYSYDGRYELRSITTTYYYINVNVHHGYIEQAMPRESAPAPAAEPRRSRGISTPTPNRLSEALAARGRDAPESPTFAAAATTETRQAQATSEKLAAALAASNTHGLSAPPAPSAPIEFAASAPPAYAPKAIGEPVPMAVASIVEPEHRQEASVAERLAALESLKSSLTESEYNNKRKEILDSI